MKLGYNRRHRRAMTSYHRTLGKKASLAKMNYYAKRHEDRARKRLWS